MEVRTKRIYAKCPHDSRLTVQQGDAHRTGEPEVWIGNGSHGVGSSLANMRRYAAWLCEMADKIETHPETEEYA